jgi:flavodoxin
MKVLVAYYSRTGTTRRIAQEISTLLECDIEEIQDMTNRSGLIGWLRSGRDAGARKLTTLKEIKNDPGLYDIVIVGTPIWNHSLSTPVRTYIAQCKDSFREVAFFRTGYTADDNPFEEMELLSGKKPKATMKLQSKQEIEPDQHQEKLQEFIRQITR